MDNSYKHPAVEEAWDFIKRTALVQEEGSRGATFHPQQVIRALNKLDDNLSKVPVEINREEKVKELAEFMVEYWEMFPTLGSSGELADKLFDKFFMQTKSQIK